MFHKRVIIPILFVIFIFIYVWIVFTFPIVIIYHFRVMEVVRIVSKAFRIDLSEFEILRSLISDSYDFCKKYVTWSTGWRFGQFNYIWNVYSAPST